MEHHEADLRRRRTYLAYKAARRDAAAVASIDAIWERIRRNARQEFKTVTGLPFTYEVPGNYVRTSRTVRHQPKANFQHAMQLMPCDGLGELQDLQGPSYTYGILMDPRIRLSDW